MSGLPEWPKRDVASAIAPTSSLFATSLLSPESLVTCLLLKFRESTPSYATYRKTVRYNTAWRHQRFEDVGEDRLHVCTSNAVIHSSLYCTNYDTTQEFLQTYGGTEDPNFEGLCGSTTEWIRRLVVVFTQVGKYGLCLLRVVPSQ